MLQFKRDYSGLARVGLAISSGYEMERQRLIDALETVAEAADGNLQVYLDGKPFTRTCRCMLGVLQKIAQDGDGAFVPKRGKVYGVKIRECGKQPRWWTNEKHTYADALSLVAYETERAKKLLQQMIFEVAEIPEGEKY